MDERDEARPGAVRAGDATVYPEFRLTLPNGGPQARGRVLPQKGMNGSLKFLVLAGSPVHPEETPGIPPYPAAQRERLVADGGIRRGSDRWPNRWETTRDLAHIGRAGR